MRASLCLKSVLGSAFCCYSKFAIICKYSARLSEILFLRVFLMLQIDLIRSWFVLLTFQGFERSICILTYSIWFSAQSLPSSCVRSIRGKVSLNKISCMFSDNYLRSFVFFIAVEINLNEEFRVFVPTNCWEILRCSILRLASHSYEAYFLSNSIR